MKTCRKCKEDKNEAEFYPFAKGKNGLYAQCKDCCRARHKETRKKYAGRVAAGRDKIKSTYGITLEDKYQIFLKQGSMCAICKSTEHCGARAIYPSNRPEVDGWAIDHCHATGAVRGIVCSRCNVMLGMARDSITTLSAAVEYLNSGVVYGIKKR